jgi:hypothetical protein
MSSPFVYTPNSQYQPTPYLEPYYNQQQISPFIPTATLYPSSPYTGSTSLPGSPHLGPTSTPGTPRRVHFGDDFDLQYDAAAASWNIPQRQRRPSWHGGSGNFGTPTLSPTFLQPAPLGYFRDRRHSFGNTGSPYQQPTGFQVPAWGPYVNPAPPSPWSSLYPPQPVQFHIHPWLNGESPRGDFLFNLSSQSFSPLRVVGPGQSALLSLEDLKQPATHPPLTRLRITCDIIPQWPIELEYNPYQNGELLSVAAPAAPPITLGDVLIALHRSLNQKISHVDWARLTLSEETAVSRAYARRCRAAGSVEMLERSQGVRRVDFLLERVWFKGLIRSGDGWEGMKMILG